MISGCSGGGKSTLVEALARRGFATVPEPGRRIVAEELRGAGLALPDRDLALFARRAVALALADRAAPFKGRWRFFDRGLVDAAVALAHATGQPLLPIARAFQPYDRLVFLAPPWPRIYRPDRERRHGFEAALAEYERLAAAYPALGYEVAVLPRIPVEARAEFVIGRLEARER